MSLALALVAAALAAPFPVAQLGGPTGVVALDGHTAVVNLWASWCAPCLRELPLLDQLAARLDGSARVVAVSVDTTWGPASGVVARLGLRLPVAHDPTAALPRQLQSPGLPVTYVLDAQREVRRTIAHALDADDIADLEAYVRTMEAR